MLIIILIFAAIAVVIYCTFFGMAGRDWKGIKKHDRWKREQEKRQRKP